MGCDIHLAVEVRGKNGWERRLPPPEARDAWLVEMANKARADGKLNDWSIKRELVTWYDERSYDAFAILANVRNGTWGDPFNSISEPKGLPADSSHAVAVLNPDHQEHNSESGDIWLGEHSHSWLSLKELLSFDWNQTIQHRGYVHWTEFAKRVASGDTKSPGSYCGGASGEKFSEETARQMLKQKIEPGNAWAHVLCEWKSTYAESADFFHKNFLPRLVELRDREKVTDEDVRIVFGFDS